MRNAKFTLNSFILVVIVITGIFLFFSISVVDLADGSAMNEYYPVDGCEANVCYSNLRPCGLYVGDKNTGTLKLEGNYGHDWGAAAVGRTLYINEYTPTSYGLTLCRLVKVDLDTYDKQVLYPDTILRGRCASGELVCLGGFLMPTGYPKTDSLLSLYSFSSKELQPENDSALVMFLDPETGEVVYSERNDEALTIDLDRFYLSRTLEEVMK